MTTTRLILALLIPTCALATPAWTQSAVGNGRLLDANPRVGSGGRNSTLPTYRPLNSQLYVTGQVTGLGRFRGTVGYTPENELSAEVPSAVLDDFRRQSVGLEDVTSGQATYVTSPYLSRTRGVQTRSNVLQRDMLPSYGPRGAQDSAYDRDFYDRFALRGIVPSYEQLMRSPAAETGMGITTPRGDLQNLYDLNVQGNRPGAEALLGLLDSSQRQSLARELSRLGQRRREALDEDYYANERNLPRSLQGSDGAPVRVPPVEGQRSEDAELQGQGLPKPGEDVFFDLLNHFRANEPRSVRPSEGPDAVLQSAARRTVTIDRLAGSSSDPTNALMRLGQEQLGQGRFYDAAEQFGQAIVREGRNPLAHVGRGLSLFAAGEPAAAAQEMETSLQLFPEMMATRVSVMELLDQRVYERRMDNLERQLAGDNPDPNLLFLATYLSHNAGDSERAGKFARMLRNQTSTDNRSYFSRYAEGVQAIQAAQSRSQEAPQE